MKVSISSPRWNVHELSERAELWELVCLSLNLEPDSDTIDLREFEFPSGHIHHFSAREFRDRLRIAVNHIGSGSLRAAEGGIAAADPAHTVISFGAFAKFADSQGWSLP